MTGENCATEYAELAKLPDLTGIWYPDGGRSFGGRGKGAGGDPGGAGEARRL